MRSSRLPTSYTALLTSLLCTTRALTVPAPLHAFTPQTVAILGAGAIGCYYGARLQEQGHTVHFITPSGYEELSRSGLEVSSPVGDLTLPRVSAYSSSADLRGKKLDWAIVCLKSYALSNLQDLLTPLVSTSTRILVIMNGLTLEDEVQAMFPSNSIFGGMAFICANRRTYSIVAHLDYGLLTIGHISDDSLELEHASALWAEAKVPVKMSTCLRASRWEKLCWNFPFNGVSCAMGGITVDHILRDDDLRKLAEDVMREVVKLGNADLAAQGYQKEVLLQEEEIVENMFRLTSTMGAYRPSTMIDLLEGRRMEVNIFTTPVRIASRLGAQCTVLDSVTRMVCAHQRLRDNKREGRTSVFLQKYA